MSFSIVVATMVPKYRAIARGGMGQNALAIGPERESSVTLTEIDGIN